jgi:hypothetical protein
MPSSGMWLRVDLVLTDVSVHSSQTPQKTTIIVDVFTVFLLRSGLYNTVLLLLGADDIENTASSIVV